MSKSSQISLKNTWLNILLFFATIISTLFAGAFQETGTFSDAIANLHLGWKFSFSLMGILLAHELGHYFASRIHNVPSSLPYFLPVPHPLVGTFGAFIKMRGKISDKKALLDIGVAGPIMGLVVAIPLLFFGLSKSSLVEITDVVGHQMMPLLGGSILFKFISFIIFGYVPPELGIQLHPVAYASWLGLWVTSINLIPMGQLDGGHISYAIFGKWHKWISYGVFIVMIILGIFFWLGWLFWAFITSIIVRFKHPPPEDNIAPIDNKRKIIGIIALILFILTFLPIPFH
jgi:membrane-associated protease RseP (regulator of RpoE activity)